MAQSLQDLAEALALRVSRAVAIDDTALRILAYSPHVGPVDETRLDSILHRRASDSSREWVLSLGIAQLEEPLRVPANDALGMMPRVCVPIRSQTLLLGYVWLIDLEQTLTDEDLAVASEPAEAAGLIMYREQLLGELERSRERELVRDLLSDEPAVRERAAETGELQPGSLVTAIVARATPPGGEVGEDLRVKLATALERAKKSVPTGRSLALARHDQAVLLVGQAGRIDPLEVAATLRANTLELQPDLAVYVGVGSAVPLTQVHLSYQQAGRAIRVAEIVPSFEPVVAVGQLGVYGLLSQLPVEQLTVDALHPGLVRLMQAEGGTPLIATLEAYLDAAGDARGTAETLMIHRTSLYYRLGRIEEIAGVDLGRGEDRLALQLGLKIARLAALYP